MKLLYLDACHRGPEISRTSRLGRAFLDEFTELRPDAELTVLNLDELKPAPLCGETYRERCRLLEKNRLDDPRFDWAHRFAEADMIVVAAPYWDFSFPASLKAFIEQVCVYGITFIYENDQPVGLCRAENLVYLTTAGGYIAGDNWGAAYLRGVTHRLLGVRRFHEVAAEAIDIAGADSRALVDAAADRARALAGALAKSVV